MTSLEKCSRTRSRNGKNVGSGVSRVEGGTLKVTSLINHLTPNDHYSGRTAPPTSKRRILYIYSTNIGTEYFKHGVYTLRFFLFKMQFVS